MKVNTVCMTMVASRNLTTLFASACMMHPQIQVLNHCSSINRDEKTNFLAQYTDQKLSNFINKVVDINHQSLKIPGEGGVITKAHAFNSDEKMRELYYSRFASEKKPELKSIVWKDSAKNTAILQTVNVSRLLYNTDRLRFILTLRNPMDCATSNSSPGYNTNFRMPNKEAILDELFERYLWFFDLQKKHPKNFMTFFEYEPDDKLLDRLQGFLMIDNDERWKKDFQQIWVLKRRYDHPANFKDQYRTLIKTVPDQIMRQKFERHLDE
jgi:hypothetical protein